MFLNVPADSFQKWEIKAGTIFSMIYMFFKLPFWMASAYNFIANTL